MTRWEWSVRDGGDPAAGLAEVLRSAGLPVDDLTTAPARPAAGVRGAALLLGAAGCAALAGLDPGPPSPAPGVPDIAVVVLGGPAALAGAGGAAPDRPAPDVARLGAWSTTWTDAEHAAAVEEVRGAIARGDVYQVNVVGHRSAPLDGDPGPLLDAVVGLPGAVRGGVLAGERWAVASASPETLVTVRGGVARTAPVKGTRAVAADPTGDDLRSSAKDRAEHVMIVDLARNDLGRLARPGSVRVESLYALRRWAGLWQAESLVAADLRAGTGLLDVLRAVAPGGSVTGAPKRAAVSLLAGLEPVGRGPAMGALGVLTPHGLDLGLTIRTVAVAEGRVHLWAGGGITWSSDPADEVAEAHAKAAPVLAALAGATGAR